MPLRFTIRDLLWLIVLLVPIADLPGCSAPIDFDTQYEKRDLTFGEFHEFLPQFEPDLRGCSHIDIVYVSTRDSYDLWLKCQMPKTDYEALVAQLSRDTETIEPFFDDDRFASAAPQWWQLKSGEQKPQQHWFREKDDHSSHHRGSAAYFDERSQTFRLWQWSRQWETTPSGFERNW